MLALLLFCVSYHLTSPAYFCHAPLEPLHVFQFPHAAPTLLYNIMSYLHIHTSFLLHHCPYTPEVVHLFQFFSLIFHYAFRLFESTFHPLCLRSTDSHSHSSSVFLHDSRYSVIATSLPPHRTTSSANIIDSGTSSVLSLSIRP